MITYSTQKPPIYQKCVDAFGVDWEDGVIFTYGETIYCKHNPIHPSKQVHEGVHVLQQREYGKDPWWDRYLEDIDFRLQQEKEAYLVESEWAHKNIKDRNERVRFIIRNARTLSSSMYGNIISYSEAFKLLNR